MAGTNKSCLVSCTGKSRLCRCLLHWQQQYNDWKIKIKVIIIYAFAVSFHPRVERSEFVFYVVFFTILFVFPFLPCAHMKKVCKGKFFHACSRTFCCAKPFKHVGTKNIVSSFLCIFKHSFVFKNRLFTLRLLWDHFFGSLFVLLLPPRVSENLSKWQAAAENINSGEKYRHAHKIP